MGMPLLNSTSPVSGSTPVDLQLLVGNRVAERAGDGERPQEANRRSPKPLPKKSRGRGGAGVVVVDRVAWLPVARVRANSRDTPKDSMNSCSGLT